MAEPIDISTVLEGLMEEFDACLQQREETKNTEETARKLREELDRKLAALQQSIQGLSRYATAQEKPLQLTNPGLGQVLDSIKDFDFGSLLLAESPKTLTECCREILNKCGDWMSPVQVRQALQAAGFDFSQYTSNPLSSIHTTLKRIKEAGNADDEVRDGTTYYRWKVREEQPAPRAARGRATIDEPIGPHILSGQGAPAVTPRRWGRRNAPDVRLPVGPPTDFGKKK